MKYSDIVNKYSQEVMQDILKLNKEIKFFQKKVNNEKNNKDIYNDNLKGNYNYFNNGYKDQKQIP